MASQELPGPNSVNRAVLEYHLGAESEARLDGAAFHDPRHILAQRGTVFEAMPRAAAYQPDVFKRGMTVDQEIAVRGVLVLADAALNHGSIFHGGEKMSNVTAGFLQPFGGRDPPASVGG